MEGSVGRKRWLSDSNASPPKRSRWFVIEAPELAVKDEEEEEKSVLLLKPFSPMPHVCFDRVKLGSSKTCVLYLLNPFDVAQDVIIEKFPFESGFFIEETKFCVGAKEEKPVTISWRPEKASNCRETIKFKSSLGCKSQAYLLGAAYSPPTKKTNRNLRTKVLKENVKPNGCNVGVLKLNPTNKSTQLMTSNKENVNSGNAFFSSLEVSPEKAHPLRQSAYFALHDGQDFPESPVRRQTYTIRNMLMCGRKSEVLPVQDKNSIFVDNVLKEKQFILQQSSVVNQSSNVVEDKPLSMPKTFNVIKQETDYINDNLKLCDLNINDGNRLLKRRTFNVLKSKIECTNELELKRHEQNVNCLQKSNSSLDSTNTEDKVVVHDIIAKHTYFGLSPESKGINNKRYTHVIGHKFSENSEYDYVSKSEIFSSKIINDIGKEHCEISDVFKRSDSHLDVSFSNLTHDRSDVSELSSDVGMKKKSEDKNNHVKNKCSEKKDEAKESLKNVRFSNFTEKVAFNDVSISVPENNFYAASKLNSNLNLKQDQHFIPCASKSKDKNANNEQSCNGIFDPERMRENKWNMNFNNCSYKKVSLSESVSSDASEIKGKELSKQSTIQKSSTQEHIQSSKSEYSRETYFEIPYKVERTVHFSKSDLSLEAFQPHLSNESTYISSDIDCKSSVDRKKLKRSPFKAKAARPLLKKAQCDKVSASVKFRKNPAQYLPRQLNLKKTKIADSALSHRNPFASSNLYYDTHWKVKQEVAFTNWLNYILTPADSITSSDVKVDSAQIWNESIKDTATVRAPTKEELSLKTYTAVKNLNQLRKACCMLYQSDDFAAVVKRIEKEVDTEKLSVRKDRALHADLGIKKEILDKLLSYNSLWLRIGLETIYGEIIVLQNNSDIIGLSRFIIRRLLSDPEIVSKFSYSAVRNYFKPGYEEEIKRFILKKFLLLVYFLDKAKVAHLMKNDPCLFSKHANYKNSKALLFAFSRDYLSGEGDITKHLRFLGYRVTHEQTAREEFDFSVKNIAVDLRCGLRLGRVVELLFQDWSISPMLRFNTSSRLNKVYNNDVILRALQKASIEIENDIKAKDLVEGNQEKTLDLLWQIVFKTQISKLLNKELLRQENEFLCRNLKLKVDYAAFKALRNPNTESEFSHPSFLDSKLYKENEVLQLLLQWCQNVCAYYGLKVHNFTSSFSDGRVLCLLLHHYHPNLLPYKNIRTETSSTVYEKQMIAAEADDDSSPFHLKKNQELQAFMKEYLKNDKYNLSLAFQKFLEIGQIPILSKPDAPNILPDEKVMITLVSYVNMRLMELSVEIRAARKILHAWRRWHFKKDQDRLKTEISAVQVIQKAWRAFIKQKNMKNQDKAVVVMQCAWRKYSARKQLKALKHQKHCEFLNQKAQVIQACIRGYMVRKKIKKCCASAIVIQSCIRMWLLKSKFQKLKKVTVRIQQKYQARVSGRSQRLKFVSLKLLTIQLQSHCKGYMLRKILERQSNAAVVIQSNIRRYLAMKNFKIIKNACVLIQQKFRATMLAKKLQENFLRQKAAAIKLQKWYRSVRKKRTILKSVFRIQAVVYGYLLRKRYNALRRNVLKIQTWWRACILAKQAQISYSIQRRQVILVQSAVRKFITRASFKRKRQSAIVIQKHVRAFQARKRFCLLKEKVRYIQQWYKSILSSRKIRKEYLHYKEAVINIQSWYRMCYCKKKFSNLKKAVSVIETYRFGKCERMKFLDFKQKVIKIQSMFRGYKCRQEWQKVLQSVISIQSFYRKHKAERNFVKLKESAIKVQIYYRSYRKMKLDQQRYFKMKKGFINLQALHRGRSERKKLCLLNKKAIVIQSCFRKWTLQRSFKKKRKACITIQQHFRAWLEMEKQHKEYLCFKKAIISCQASVRRYLALKQYRLIRSAIIKIQTYVRMILASKKYCGILKATVSIQKQYRMIVCRRQFLNLKKSSVVIQSHFRCHAARKNYISMKNAVSVLEKHFKAKKIGHTQRNKYLKMKNSCIVIQAAFRKYCKRREFLKWKKAVIKIEQYYCSYKMMCLQRQRFLKMKIGFVYLQAAYQGLKVRKFCKKLNENAVIIQTCFRSWVAQRKYKKIKTACIFVQQKYRANVKMHSDRQKYLKMKKGFVELQAVYQGLKARKHLNYLKQQAIIIQTAFRRWMKEKKYKEMKQAAIVLQQKYRALVKMRNCRKKYFKMKHGFTFLQASYRGLRVRKHYADMNKKATKIQAYFRRWITQRDFLKLRQASITIQRKRRANLLASFHNRRYLQMKRGFILLQALYRGSKVRKQNDLLNQKAVIIQSAFRCWVMNNQYKRMRQACMIIQRKYRAQILMRSNRYKYLKMKKGFTCLQAVYKGAVVRREVALVIHNVILVQSACRRWLSQKKYKKLRKACIIIQQRYRAQVSMQIDQQKYLLIKKGFTRLQAIFRGANVRKQNAMLACKAVIIQSAFRRWVMQKKYVKYRVACIIIQQRFKAQIKMRSDRQKYFKMKKGFTHLQAVCRGINVRKQIALFNHSAIIIQCAFRTWKMHKEYKIMRQACIIIQRRHRAQIKRNLCRQEYLKMKKGFVLLQALYRGSKVRKHKEMLLHNVIIIQSTFRKWVKRQRYKEMRQACIIIQQRYRAQIQMISDRERYLKMKKGFSCLQALYRGSKVRRQICLANQNAITIQTAYRKWLMQKKYRQIKQSCIILQKWLKMYFIRKRFSILKTAVTKIQSYYRLYKKMCSDRERFLKMKTGFLALQALSRGVKVRNYYTLLNKKATIIQTCFKGWSVHKQYIRKKTASILIQQKFRAFSKRRIHQQNYLKMKRGFLLLQALFRGFLMRNRLSVLNRKAIIIQSSIRGYFAQKRYRTLRSACVTLQQKYLAILEMRRKRQQFLTMKDAAITLQAAIRCHLVHKKYMVMMNASIKIQSMFRMFMARKFYRNRLRVAVFIQSFYRMHLSRRKFIIIKQSCITIQSSCRKYLAQKRYSKLRNSAVVIQKYFVAMQKSKKQRDQYLCMKHSAIVIQSYFRSYRLRTKFLRMKHAVIKLEQYYFAYKIKVEVRQNYLKLIHGFIQFQALYRGRKTRMYVSTLKKSAIVIQTNYRRWLARKNFQRHKAAVLIQKNFRLWKKRRLSYISNRRDLYEAYQLHRWYVQLKQSMIKFQRYARSYIQRRTKAVILIQSCVRMWLAKKELDRHKAAKKIQALWRGFVLRSSITSDDIIKAQKRIKSADSSDCNKLKNRTRESLHTLLNGGQIHDMIVALEHLDVCTRLSPNCCESLVMSGSLTVLLQLLGSCNRSVPHMEIIKFTTSILLNIAKYNKTVDYLWDEMPSLDIYLHLMKAFRDKGTQIFTKCCTLLWIFCQDPKKAKIIKENQLITKQLCSLHLLISRKQPVNEKRQQLKVASSSANNTICGSFCRSMTKSICERESLEICPEWLLGKNRKKEFTDPLIAITSVTQSLALKAKKCMPK